MGGGWDGERGGGGPIDVPSPPAPPPPDAVRRRLSLGGCTSPVDKSDTVAASRSPSPAVVCSQYRTYYYRLHQMAEGSLSSRYPTPPAAPPKDGYIAESESESESLDLVFYNGKLKVHKTYNSPVPLTYVDTGVYEGGSNDYFEAHTH